VSETDSRRSATRIVLLYFLGAGVWILGSDLALLAAYPDSAPTVIGSLIKGGLFLVFTSALLYLVLRNRPTADAPAGPLDRVGDTQRQSRWPALFPFMLLTAALVSACAWLFVREQHEHRLIARQQLESRADIKARELGLWLKDQAQSALSYGRARSFQEDLPSILRGGDSAALARVEKRLEEVRGTHELDTILVLDPGGRVLVAVGNQRGVSAGLAHDVAEVAQTRKPRLHVLRHAGDASGAPIVLDQIVPVDLAPPTETAPAVLVLRDNAASTLFTMVRYWPVESRTGEVYLVRRAGDRIEYLSELKAKPGAPLTPGASAASEERVSAQLIRSVGFAEKAVDYRGVAVLAASRAVPGTDWQVIAKMDLDEVLEPARDQAQIFLFLIVGLTLLAAYGANRLWRQQAQVGALRERAEAIERKRVEGKLSAAEERYRALFERSLDCVFLADFEGNFLDANRAALDLLGYSREEIPSISYRTLLDPADLPGAFASLQDVIRTGTQREVGVYTLRRKNGQQVIVETKTALVYDEDKPSAILGIAHDITGRKQAEEKIGRLNRVYAVLSGINTLILHVSDRQALFNGACRIAVEQGKFEMAWIGTIDPATQDVTPVSWSGVSAEELTRAKSSGRDDTPLGRGAVGQAIRGRHPVFNNDIAAHSFGGPRVEKILSLGFRSQITLPLFEGRAVVGILTMYAREPNYFNEEEVRLLTELAGDISFALENLAGEQVRQHVQRELDYKSTILLTQQETSPDAILVVDDNARIVSYNRQFLGMWGIAEEIARAGVDEPVLNAVVGHMRNRD
jgi:PAS domain S-box-containing protein